MIITEETIKKYFSEFYIEQLTCDENNRQLLNSFCADSKYGVSLERYLKEKAWDEDEERHVKVYLVKDKKGDIVAYFSLKCGLLYEPKYYDNLAEDEKILVDSILEAMDNNDFEALENYKAAADSLYGQERMKLFFECVQEQRKIRQEAISDITKTLAVQVCHSAIELSHLCRIEKIPEVVGDIPFCVGLFWEHIAPLVIEIAGKVGCRYLYLFAADVTANNNMMEQSNRKLIDYYKINFKFQSNDKLYFIKPEYDRGCWCLCQSIADLERNKSWIWKQFVGDLE